MTNIEVIGKLDRPEGTILVIDPEKLVGMDSQVTDGTSVYKVVRLLPGGSPGRMAIRVKQIS